MYEILNLLESFVDLPVWLRYCIGALGILSFASIGLFFSPIIMMIVLLGVLIVIVVLGIYFYILKKRRQVQQASLSGHLEQNTLATPLAISDPARKAKLESLRKRFQEGLDKFKAVGKDIYKLPWYVVIGEPGGGKSEAIRRCDVGFPPGMQDDFQGVGGTVNMNWWFTNYAVILDTAGRLLFEEVAPGTTSEWKEFLKLLRKNRPNCPVNGLLLFIPADSLIKGTSKLIDERAGLITRQLDGIQRELDIRFPVYVVISKCDLLNGFRETFEHLDDADEQRQMIGWSNPDAIDTPFDPALVDKHLQTVVERLRRRRLKLLEDPVAKDSSHRRTDEVDRLYAFPNSVALIAPNLRRYLTKIFVVSEWSAKPLFLRGIYFTSSLCEGSELDQELAQAVGVSVDALPGGRSWTRESSLFLRDLFLEKIFREWGLVTRATNTLRLVRQRKIALFATLFVALLALVVFSWLGYVEMRNSIGHQSGYWLRASEGWTDKNEWMPIVTPTADGYVYNGDRSVGGGISNQTQDLFSGSRESLVAFHEMLRLFSGESLQISPVFRPLNFLAGNLDTERKRAQRIVFEGSVVKPLVEAARGKISLATPSSSTDPQLEAKALLGLIQLESGIVKRGRHLGEKIAPPNVVLSSLQDYVVTQEFDKQLADLSDWTYTVGDGAEKWPPDWLSAGSTLVKDKPGYNQAIDLGIEHFREHALQSLAGSEAKWKMIIDLVDFLKNQYAPKEQSVFQGASNQGSIQQLDPLLATPYAELAKVDSTLDQKIKDAKTAGLFKDGPVTLEAAYDLAVKDYKAQQGALKTMLDAMLAETLTTETQVSQPSPLLKEIQDRLNAAEKDTQSDLQGLDVAELKALDQAYVADYAGHGPVYSYRFSLYTLCFGTTSQKARFDNLIGSDWAALKTIIDDVAKARAEVVTYQGESKNECGAVCAYWLAYAEQNQIGACCTAYLKQAKDAVGPMLHFPIVWPPEDSALTVLQIANAKKQLELIHTDLHSENFGKIRPESRAPLEGLDKQLALLDPVLRALIGLDGNVVTCSISGPLGSPPAPVYVPPPPPPPPSAPGAPPAPVPPGPPPPPVVSYELRKLTWPQLASETTENQGNLGNQGRVALGSPRTLIENFPVDQFFHFHRYDGQDYDNGDGKTVPRLEIPCGFDWSALRLLSKATPAGDGLNWNVKLDDKHPDVSIDIVFQRALPLPAQWPTREAVLPGE